MDSATFAALADPTRLRIVELLGARPYAVGEIAKALGIRQPQATKHLQILNRAGLVTIHPLAQRRIYALDRKSLHELQAWLDGMGDGGAAAADALEQYQQAIEFEAAQAATDPHWARGREMTLRQDVAADPALVWAFWTSPERLRTWWAPDYFTVSGCDLDLRPGGVIEIELQEGDGTRHRATGTFERIARPHRLSFTLGPLDPNGDVLLRAHYTVRLRSTPGGTALFLHSRIIDSAAEASALVAGMRPGWQQALAKLARAVERAR